MHEEIITEVERAAELFAAAGDREGRSKALLNVAMALRALGRFQDSLAAFGRVVDLVTDPRTAPAPWIADITAMTALSEGAQALLHLGRWQEAKEAADRALALDSRVGVPALHGEASLSKAHALWGLGEQTEARRVAQGAFTPSHQPVTRTTATKPKPSSNNGRLSLRHRRRFGLWAGEDAKWWLQVLTEIKNRAVDDTGYRQRPNRGSGSL
ncbi:tetratricopeptide repeat protein [Streptomyces sp. NPDC056682]|uniref:tetratricopeptide repeat protein n=1 Tax=Streptomyces sp. NPDC056682 TaxID=3345909 RepID=UPI0036BD45CC